MTAAEDLFGGSYRRLTAAFSRALLLPDQEIVAAAAKLSEAATRVLVAYGADNLYQPKAAAARREAADIAFQEAFGELARVARGRLHPPPVERRRRWWPVRRSVATVPAVEPGQQRASLTLRWQGSRGCVASEGRKEEAAS
jgi:hypothetical protein